MRTVIFAFLAALGFGASTVMDTSVGPERDNLHPRLDEVRLDQVLLGPVLLGQVPLNEVLLDKVLLDEVLLDEVLLDKVLLDDFEAYDPGGVPTRWQVLLDRGLVELIPEYNSDRERFSVESEPGNQFVRASVTDQSHRIILPNGDWYDWDLNNHPTLSWTWRAIQLPPGAREDKSSLNDTGAALYVYFGRDWLGRPKGIKYTYSSTLPVGTSVRYGALRVLVVSSAVDTTNVWVEVRRDVAADYRELFNRDPPDRPDVIALWSDSDNTGSTAIADFDNLAITDR